MSTYSIGIDFSMYCPSLYTLCMLISTRMQLPYETQKYHNIVQAVYRIAQNFDRGKFWRFWCFPARPSKFNPSNCSLTIQCLQVYGERQWPSVKIFEESVSVKISPHQNFTLYGITCTLTWMAAHVRLC